MNFDGYARLKDVNRTLWILGILAAVVGVIMIAAASASIADPGFNTDLGVARFFLGFGNLLAAAASFTIFAGILTGVSMLVLPAVFERVEAINAASKGGATPSGIEAGQAESTEADLTPGSSQW